MSKVANHLHRYKKTNLGTKSKPYWVYRCMKPACSHYIPITTAEGRLIECNRCHEPMIYGKKQMYGSHGKPMAQPHCDNCIQRKVSKDVAALANFLGQKTGS